MPTSPHGLTPGPILAARASRISGTRDRTAGERRRLRFSASVPNLGAAAAVVPGPDTAPDLCQFDPCHGHFHLEGFASYDLLDDQGQVLLTGRKQGYFLVDATPYCMDAAPAASDPADQRVSPGWADIYTAEFPCQFLDITDTPDGQYTLRVAIDNDNLIDEADALPNDATVRIAIAGDEVTVLP